LDKFFGNEIPVQVENFLNFFNKFARDPLVFAEGSIHKRTLKIPKPEEVVEALRSWIGSKKTINQIDNYLRRKFAFEPFSLMGYGHLEPFLLANGFVIVGDNPQSKVRFFSLNIRPANIPPEDELITEIVNWRNSATGLVIGTDDLADFLAKHYKCDFSLFGYGDLETFLTTHGFTVVPVNKYLFFNPKQKEPEKPKNEEEDEDKDEDNDDEDDEEMEEEEGGKSTGAEEDSDDDSCIVCMENERNCVILVCGHLGLCLECASKYNSCPLCRRAYTREQVIKVFNA